MRGRNQLGIALAGRFGGARSICQANVRAKRASIAARPLSSRKRVPVPQKRGWRTTGSRAGWNRSPVQGEVHLVDAMALRGRAERRLGPPRSTAEENAVLAPHVVVLPRRLLPDRPRRVKRGSRRPLTLRRAGGRSRRDGRPL